MNGSWWRVLKKRGPLEKGMANHFIILALRIPWTVHFSSVQALSCVRLFVTPWITACQVSLSISNSRSSPKLMCIQSVMASRHPILCRPLLLLPPIPPRIRDFSSQSTLRMRWPKYWSFSCSIIPSKEHPGLISFRMDWLDLLAVQGILKETLQTRLNCAENVNQINFFFQILILFWQPFFLLVMNIS